MAFFNIPITDYSNEDSTASFPVADAVLDASLTSLFNAVDGIVIGAIGQSKLNVSAAKDAGPGGNSADKFAQRKLKWLCRYHDATTLEALTLEIACPDAALLTGNTDFADLGAGDGLAFKTDFDTHVKARRTGNAVVLDSVQLVGRRLNRKKQT